MVQNPHLELSKYQTLPGKLRKKSELRAELNGDAERGEYLSPVQLSPVRSHDPDYSLSEFLHLCQQEFINHPTNRQCVTQMICMTLLNMLICFLTWS